MIHTINARYMKKLIVTILIPVCLAIVFTGCSKLSLQKDFDHNPHTLDPKLYKTAGQFLKDRAAGPEPRDTIFRRMMQGLIYAEIDPAEYEKQGRTFILLHNEAIYRTTKVSGKDSMQIDCFFGANFVNGKPATKWEDYPKEFVKSYLLYLIAEGIHDHYTIAEPGRNVTASTLATAGSLATLPAGITRHVSAPFVPNADSKIKFKVLNSSPSNTSDYPIMVNDVRNMRTSSLLATNGTVHVIDRFLTTTLPE